MDGIVVNETVPAEDMAAELPLVEIFETVEGEGTAAGYPTIFIRLFGCPLRCRWCDTPYSYAPAAPEFTLTVAEIVKRVRGFRARRICVTGGEPLMYRARSAALLRALAAEPQIVDVHVETSGAIPLAFYIHTVTSPVVRYIVDYKLPDSGEEGHMHVASLDDLRAQDEVKFVIASDRDFDRACEIWQAHASAAVPLFSPVWGKMEPGHLVRRLLETGPQEARLSLQMHKIIWDPDTRGV